MRNADCGTTKFRDYVGIALIGAGITGACAGDLARRADDQATAWVPLQAEFRAVGAGVESRGRFMRHRNGSTRRETFGPDQRPAFVTIENLGSSEFHSFSAGTWTTQPLAARRPVPPTASAFPNAMPSRIVLLVTVSCARTPCSAA